MDFPASIRNAVAGACRKHPDDVPAAIDVAEKAIRKLPDFDTFVALMIHHSIQEMVYDDRHRFNGQLHKNAGADPKVIVGNSEAVLGVYGSIYAYHVAGKTLGELLGSELPTVRATEQAIASGHLFNVALLEWVESQGVGDEQRVKDAIPEKKLAAQFRRLQKKANEETQYAAAGH